MHLEAKKARQKYAELKHKEKQRHQRNLKITHEKEMYMFGKNVSTYFV